MRYSGPVGIKLRGSATTEHVNIGRKFLGQMLQRMKYLRLKRLEWRRILADGTVIIVASLYGRNYIHIEALERGVEAVVLYLETGLNEFTLLGSETDQPGDWKIADGAPASGVHQGLYGDAAITYVASNESLAIGETTEPTPSQAAAVQKKKAVAGYFPASRFNGLMRLYMQAQYGANNEASFQFAASSITALSIGSIAIGFTSSRSVGLVRVGVENDLDYRLIVISKSGAVHTVTEYPVIFDYGTDDLQADYIAETDADNKLQKLAYLFGHCSISTSAPTVVGTFTLSNQGSDICYGWKFNQSGTAASICLTENYTDGSDDIHYDSSLVTITFGADVSKNVTLSVSEGTTVRWVSSAPLQIWQPNLATGTCSRWCAGWMDIASYPGPYNFSNAPVYCWYDEADVLQEVQISRGGGHANATKTLLWSPNITPTIPAPYDISHIKKGWVLQTEPRWGEEITWPLGSTVDTATVAGNAVAAHSGVMQIDRFKMAGGTPTADGSTFTFISGAYASDGGWSTALGFSPDHQEILDHYNEDHSPALWPHTSIERWGTGERTRETGQVDGHNNFCDVYIPSGDSEAVYYAELEYTSAPPNAYRDTGSDVFGQTVNCGLDDEEWTDIEVWSDASVGYGTTTPYTSEPLSGSITMYLSSKSQNHIAGTYQGSAYQYFMLPKTSPDPVAKTYTESYNLDVFQGSDITSTSTEAGIWTGWM